MRNPTEVSRTTRDPTLTEVIILAMLAMCGWFGGLFWIYYMTLTIT